ncbi:MAG: DNA-binding XRE family transcriptional regulator [Candidatus Aldehydirespiratoraceae bacterium]|jgi:DNA-binding XRE family transcriptional regulator
MAKKFSELAAPLHDDHERSIRIEALTEKARAETIAYRLAELRKESGITQTELAERLGITQGAVSACERSADLKLSTLRRHVAALGGTVHIEIKLSEPTTTADA